MGGTMLGTNDDDDDAISRRRRGKEEVEEEGNYRCKSCEALRKNP
jgi:hypothetical protein